MPHLESRGKGPTSKYDTAILQRGMQTRIGGIYVPFFLLSIIESKWKISTHHIEWDCTTPSEWFY